ncbi:MAG: extracellular solute-binding protein [Anaerolineae bacterium]
MSGHNGRRLALVLIVALLVIPALAGCSQGSDKITVYTAKEQEEVAEFIPAAEEATGLEIEVLRLSTGDLTARLLAEKDNPQTDAIWGTAASSMMIFDNEGMLEPYAPEGVEEILPRFKSPKDPPTWVGVDAYINAICFNTDLGEQLGLPQPMTWEDLLDPVYEGQIVMPDPSASGTGYMFVSAAVQGMGGWEYLEALDENMAMYTKSGSKPCKMAGAGEYAVGLSFAFVGAGLKEDGAPIEFVVPNPTGYEVEANALMKGAKNPEAAKKFLDWAISDEAMNLYAKYFAVLAKPGFPAPAGMPADAVDRLYPVDFGVMASDRDSVLSEWTARFGGAE